MKKEFKPDDIVKVCKYLQIGSAMQLDGIHACCLGTTGSPILISIDEIKSGKLTYELMIERRKELFESINGINDKSCGDCKNCTFISEEKYEDVNFDYLGGEPLPTAFNIQHYTECNQRCIYCCYAQNNDFRKPQYNILDLYNLFKEKGKLRGNNWIDFSGGEPAMLKNFDEILKYMMDNDMGTVVVYSNASIYSPIIYEGLKNNKIILTTSIDTGIASSYKKIRGADVFPKVIENLIKYRNSGTNNMWLKYVVCEENRNEDDMWSFLMAMLAIRPNSVMLCPDFPYGDKEIPEETIKFIAKLWYLIEKYLGIVPVDFTSEYGDVKFVKYHEDLKKNIDELKRVNPISSLDVLKTFSDAIIPTFTKPTLLQQIFSVRNEGKNKVLRILGFKITTKKRRK